LLFSYETCLPAAVALSTASLKTALALLAASLSI
jgi:hypothetical protein